MRTPSACFYERECSRLAGACLAAATALGSGMRCHMVVSVEPSSNSSLRCARAPSRRAATPHASSRPTPLTPCRLALARGTCAHCAPRSGRSAAWPASASPSKLPGQWNMHAAHDVSASAGARPPGWPGAASATVCSASSASPAAGPGHCRAAGATQAVHALPAGRAAARAAAAADDVDASCCNSQSAERVASACDAPAGVWGPAMGAGAHAFAQVKVARSSASPGTPSPLARINPHGGPMCRATPQPGALPAAGRAKAGPSKADCRATAPPAPSLSSSRPAAAAASSSAHAGRTRWPLTWRV